MSRVALEVIVPAYNEEDRIERTLSRIREYYSEQPYTWRVTVVSDGSSDQTPQIAQKFAGEDERFRVIAYVQNRGKGHAVKTGILSADADRILFCDADLATPQEETLKLMAALDKGCDIAIGSRPLRDSKLEVRQPLYRELLGRAFNKAVKILAISGIDDTQCGFKMFTATAAHQVFTRTKLDGFGFDFEALMIAIDLGLKVDEVPIRWSHQEGSKVVLLRDGPRMLKDLVKLRMMGRNKRLLENPL